MFVRTDEDNVYEINNDHYIKDGYLYFKGIDEILGGNPENYKSKILKTAETIEELCDVAVIVGKRYNESCHWWFLRHTDMGGNNLVEIVKNYMELWGNEDYMVFEKVFGAIWTDKGLIYVAKMNDKGELELL